MATLILPIHAKADDDSNHSAHAVFIMSNSADWNEVMHLHGQQTERSTSPEDSRPVAGAVEETMILWNRKAPSLSAGTIWNARSFVPLAEGRDTEGIALDHSD